MSDRLKGDRHLGQAGLFKRTTYEDAGQMLAVLRRRVDVALCFGALVGKRRSVGSICAGLQARLHASWRPRFCHGKTAMTLDTDTSFPVIRVGLTDGC